MQETLSRGRRGEKGGEASQGEERSPRESCEQGKTRNTGVISQSRGGVNLVFQRAVKRIGRSLGPRSQASGICHSRRNRSTARLPWRTGGGLINCEKKYPKVFIGHNHYKTSKVGGSETTRRARERQGKNTVDGSGP